MIKYTDTPTYSNNCFWYCFFTSLFWWQYLFFLICYTKHDLKDNAGYEFCFHYFPKSRKLGFRSSRLNLSLYSLLGCKELFLLNRKKFGTLISMRFPNRRKFGSVDLPNLKKFGSVTRPENRFFFIPESFRISTFWKINLIWYVKNTESHANSSWYNPNTIYKLFRVAA